MGTFGEEFKKMGGDFLKVGRNAISGGKKPFAKADFNRQQPGGLADKKQKPLSLLGAFFYQKPKIASAPSANKGAFKEGNSFGVDKAYLYVKEMMRKDPKLASEVYKRYPIRNYRSEDDRDKAIVNAVLKDKKSYFKNNYEVGKNTDNQKIGMEENRMKNSLYSTPGGTEERMKKELNFKIYEGLMGRDKKK
jgi:hypothetical protein